MKVKDLIEALKKEDPERVVVFFAGEDAYGDGEYGPVGGFQKGSYVAGPCGKGPAGDDAFWKERMEEEKENPKELAFVPALILELAETQWKDEWPAGLIREGHLKFFVKGTHDPESAAIPVLIVDAEPFTDAEKGMSHATVGLSYSLCYDVVGDGVPFERRRLWELEKAHWKKRD